MTVITRTLIRGVEHRLPHRLDSEGREATHHDDDNNGSDFRADADGSIHKSIQVVESDERGKRIQEKIHVLIQTLPIRQCKV